MDVDLLSMDRPRRRSIIRCKFVDKEYEAAFQRWYRKHQLKRSVDNIVNKFNKTISIYRGERGNLPGNFSEHYDCDIIVTVVTRLEVHNIKKTIVKVDPQAFMYVQNIKEVNGGVISRKSSH